MLSQGKGLGSSSPQSSQIDRKLIPLSSLLVLISSNFIWIRMLKNLRTDFPIPFLKFLFFHQTGKKFEWKFLLFLIEFSRPFNSFPYSSPYVLSLFFTLRKSASNYVLLSLFFSKSESPAFIILLAEISNHFLKFPFSNFFLRSSFGELILFLLHSQGSSPSSNTNKVRDVSRESLLKECFLSDKGLFGWSFRRRWQSLKSLFLVGKVNLFNTHLR